jgi:multidrug efflux pump subunit AcrB
MLNRIAPFLLLIAVGLGAFAIVSIQKQKQPTVDLSYSIISIAFPGANAEEVEQLIATPAEQILSEVEGLAHIFSTSRPGMANITVQYQPGTDKTHAMVRLYDVMFSSQDWLPSNIGIEQPVIKSIGIDDIPMMTLTLWSENMLTGAFELQKVAHSLEAELMRIRGVRHVGTIGGAERVIRVIVDPAKLGAYSISINEISHILGQANTSYNAGELVRNNQAVPVQAGGFISSTQELENLVIATADESPVYLSDVAKIMDGPDIPTAYVTHFSPGNNNSEKKKLVSAYPAVTMMISYKPDANDVLVADRVLKHLQGLKTRFIPDEVNIEVSRNYSATAHDQIHMDLVKLILLLLMLGLVVAWYWGRYAAKSTMVIVVVALMLTFFMAWLYGLAVSHVSLSAMILLAGFFVIEGLAVAREPGRQLNADTELDSGDGGWFKDKPSLQSAVLLIISVLPALLIPGLVGNYLKSFLLFLVFGLIVLAITMYVFLPWLKENKTLHVKENKHVARLDVYNRSRNYFNQLTSSPWAGRNRQLSWIVLGLLLVASLAMLYQRVVIVRLLPFNDATEFQVMVDMPDGTSLEQTQRVLNAFAQVLDGAKHVSHFQSYAGISPPLALTGLVRQDYQRDSANKGAIHVNLVDRSTRYASSHQIVRDIREDLQPIANRYGAVLRFAEVSSGLPSYSPIVAEVYGQDSEQKQRLVSRIRDYMSVTDSIVDTEMSIGAASLRYVIQVDRQRASRSGLSQHEVARAIAIALKGEDVSFIHGTHTRHPVPIRLELPLRKRATLDPVLNMKLRTPSGEMVSIRDLTTIEEAAREKIIYHKDLLPVVHVTANMAGPVDSPVYGMFSIAQSIKNDQDMASIPSYLLGPPQDPYRLSIQWAGEWQLTFKAFTSLAISWLASLLLILLFLIAWLRSVPLALMVMLPVPLMVIGVLPAHFLFMQQFSVMSLLGMITISGLVIHNTVLLLTSMKQSITLGHSTEDALQAAVRESTGFIVFTAIVIILAALFILSDEVIRGLSVSLIGGIFVSTLVTLLVMPVVYYAVAKRWPETLIS